MAGSAAGKDTVQNILRSTHNIPVCVSCTTRPMREHETEGIEYFFISEQKFKDKLVANQFIESRIYKTKKGTWFYGLPVSSVDISINQITIVDEQGYYNLVKEFGQDDVLGIYLFAPETEKIDRALSRETRTDKEFYAEFYRRMGEDLTAFNEVEEDPKVFKVENSDLEGCISSIESLLKSKGVI